MPDPTPRYRSVLARAEAEAERLGHDYVGTEHLLLALVGDEAGLAAQVLGSLGVSERITELLHDALSPGPFDPRFQNSPDPWSSRVVHDDAGNPVIEPSGWPRQYFVDATGAPVLDEQGRRVHLRIGPDRQPAMGDDGRPELVAVPGEDDGTG